MKRKLSEYQLGDMRAIYYQSNNGQVEFDLVPESQVNCLKDKTNDAIDSMVQLKIEGEAAPFGFANGHTMRNNESVYDFRFLKQETSEKQGIFSISTVLQNKKGIKLYHIVDYPRSCPAISITTQVINASSEEVSLEMLSSFSVGGITPFEHDEATGCLSLHRIRSKWSAEGRIQTQRIEELQLEPSWSRHGVASEKYGQLGSMPVRKFYPFVAVEDIKNNVCWAAELVCPSSWQIEVYRRDESLCISGGLPDYDFGHWKRILKPNETFVTPQAYLTVGTGDLDEGCRRLIKMQEWKQKQKLSNLARLPVVFNEFCTTWGAPSNVSIKRCLNTLKGKDIDYFVIDAGWYADPKKGWESNMGDWIVSEKMFPEGLDKAVKDIKDAGMKPGIWFEIESVGKEAEAFYQTDHLLKKNGFVITAGNRRFWDMRDTWVKDYLNMHVIQFIKKYHFEYLKVDYNESIGIGCDGNESLGSGLYANIIAAQDFYKKIHEEIPSLFIENCSSGGHRQEPSMMELSDVASFSDAHEEKEIPVIAANLHRVILPWQNLIWVVIRKTDSPERIVYSISASFLGVMCLSGDIFDCTREQWKLIDYGIKFYRSISDIIKNGSSYIFGKPQKSYRILKNWQSVVRYSDRMEKVLIVVHVFEIEEPQQIVLSLLEHYNVKMIYEASTHKVTTKDNLISIWVEKSYDAVALLLER